MSLKWPIHGSAADVLQRMLTTGRLAHAYLFLGSEDWGKKETAIHFAKGILCEKEGEERPCGACINCHRVDTGNHPDIVYLEPDGQTIKIQQIREIQKTFALKSVEGGRKIYIITKAEQMTPEASNALLKFLEEPTSSVVAILLANRKEALLPTVVSRCQIIPFNRIDTQSIRKYLEEDGIPTETAQFVAHIKNSMDSALQFSKNEKFAEIVNLVVQLSKEMNTQRGNPLFLIQDKIIKPGWNSEDVGAFLDCLAWWYRDLVNAKLDLADGMIYKNEVTRIQSQAESARSEDLVHMVEIVLMTKKRLQSHANQQLTLEHMVLQLQGENI